MTTSQDFDRVLAAWLEDDGDAPVPAGSLERALQAARRDRPRPTFVAWFGSDWVVGPSAATRPLDVLAGRSRRQSTALIVVLFLVAGLLVVGAVLVGSRPSRPTPIVVGQQRLAYLHLDSLYLADLDGAGARRIVGPGLVLPTECAPNFESSPWSPDGRHLAFRAVGDACSPAVDVADPDGTITASFAGAGWQIPWSPDSTRIVTTDVGGDPHSMGVYGLDGVRQVSLTLPKGYGIYADYDPYWSPDGSVVLMPLRPDPGIGPRQIWEFPLDGSDPRPVADSHPWSHLHATWNPGGERFAYIPYQDSWSLVVTRADGTELLRLQGARSLASGGFEPGPSYDDPVLTPAGDRVAYIWTTDPVDVDPTQRADEIRVTDIASGSTITVARDRGISRMQFLGDGTRLLYEVSDGGQPSLRSVNVDHGGDRVLVADGEEGYWQPLVGSAQ